MQPAAQPDDVLVQNALTKLRLKKRIAEWDQYVEGPGAYGEVVQLRKKKGGALYAAKKFTNGERGRLRQPAVLTYALLAELRAMMKVNKSWQACDLLDESWCPIVWVHRLFESPPGLLMEKHGQSLAKVLRGEIMPEPGKGAPASFDDDARAKVAQDVAAAMRFLHDLGVMHGDLKDANVLVDPWYGYRAKVADFGTTRRVRDLFRGEAPGTLHALAPEALNAVCLRSYARDEPQPDVDPRPVDVYAYGILLVALWDGGQPADRHLPPAQPGLSDLSRWNSAVNHNRMRPLKVLEAMKDPHRTLAFGCLKHEPDERPTFSAVCNKLKLSLRPTQPRDAPLPNLARAVLTVKYAPSVTVGNEIVMHLGLHIEMRDERPRAMDEQGASDGTGTGTVVFNFPFLAAPGQRLSVRFGRVFGDEAAGAWVGGAVKDLVLPTEFSAAPIDPIMHIVTWRPDWERKPSMLQETPGLPAGLLVTVACEGAKSQFLGILSLLMAAPLRTLERLPSTLLGPKRPHIMISYRDTETGLCGSNFAFRLQEMLEDEGYRVFCYASAVSAGERWLSPFTNGVQACKVFIPICSPQYGDLGASPWSAAELLLAATCASHGTLQIVPIWHHGEYPPNEDTQAVLSGVPCVPDQARYGVPARHMRYDDVWQLLMARLPSPESLDSSE